MSLTCRCGFRAHGGRRHAEIHLAFYRGAPPFVRAMHSFTIDAAPGGGGGPVKPPVPAKPAPVPVPAK